MLHDLFRQLASLALEKPESDITDSDRVRVRYLAENLIKRDGPYAPALISLLEQPALPSNKLGPIEELLWALRRRNPVSTIIGCVELSPTKEVYILRTSSWDGQTEYGLYYGGADGGFEVEIDLAKNLGEAVRLSEGLKELVLLWSKDLGS